VKRILFIAVCLFVQTAHAEHDWHIGWLGGFTRNTINDPSGPTDSANKVLWKDGVVMYDLNRDSRLFASIESLDYSVDASAVNIGQDAKRTSGLLAWQTTLRMTRSFQPWVGAGLGYASEKYSPRFTQTNTGFLKFHYPDRNVSGVFAAVNANMQWSFIGDTFAGIHLQYEHGFSGLSDQVLAAVFISY
jgi:hypothetical protein